MIVNKDTPAVRPLGSEDDADAIVMTLPGATDALRFPRFWETSDGSIVDLQNLLLKVNRPDTPDNEAISALIRQIMEEYKAILIAQLRPADRRRAQEKDERERGEAKRHGINDDEPDYDDS